MKFLSIILLLFFSNLCFAQNDEIIYPSNEEVIKQREYVVYRTTQSININGIDDDSDWNEVPFTEDFVDIEGERSVNYQTRVKMLWDNDYLYVYAEMEEEHIWASLKNHDDIIFHDNDFEIFIDPDNDGRNYSEIEVNAYNTTWDLILDKPYRLGGTANDYHELAGLQSAIYIDGTINNPSDIDNYWSVEMAIPMQSVLLSKHAGPKHPKNLDIWRINFSRVEWNFEVVDNNYQRKKEKGKLLPEMNWVWSPHGEINMHIPELWGYVQFSTNRADKKIEYKASDDEISRQITYELFRRFKFGDLVHFTDKKNYFTKKIPPFTVIDQTFEAIYYKTAHGFDLVVKNTSLNKSYIIDEGGHIRELQN